MAGLGDQTYCYIHPERRAVAVCTVCRRGVCRLCHETVKGKDFCTPDAELLEGQEPPVVKVQRKRITVPTKTLQMGCYLHPNRRAVAMCPICKRGLCGSCEVLIKGRAFCKADAGILVRREQQTKSAQLRGAAITTAAIFDFLDGLGGAVVGFLLIVLGLIGPQAHTAFTLSQGFQQIITYFDNVLGFPPSQALALGLFGFMIGVIDLIGGIMLLRRSRWGALISIFASVTWALLISGSAIVMATVGIFGYFGLVVVIAKLPLIGFGWRQLNQR
jgi:hypothetical protein